MRVYVAFTDGTEQEYTGKDLKDIARQIEDTVTGCDFVTTPQEIEELNENDEIIQVLECSWSLELEKVPKTV